MIHNYIGLASLNQSINYRPYISKQNSYLWASPCTNLKKSLIKHIMCSNSFKTKFPNFGLSLMTTPKSDLSDLWLWPCQRLGNNFLRHMKYGVDISFRHPYVGLQGCFSSHQIGGVDLSCRWRIW